MTACARRRPPSRSARELSPVSPTRATHSPRGAAKRPSSCCPCVSKRVSADREVERRRVTSSGCGSSRRLCGRHLRSRRCPRPRWRAARGSGSRRGRRAASKRAARRVARPGGSQGTGRAAWIIKQYGPQGAEPVKAGERGCPARDCHRTAADAGRTGGLGDLLESRVAGRWRRDATDGGGRWLAQSLGISPPRPRPVARFTPANLAARPVPPRAKSQVHGRRGLAGPSRCARPQDAVVDRARAGSRAARSLRRPRLPGRADRLRGPGRADSFAAGRGTRSLRATGGAAAARRGRRPRRSGRHALDGRLRPRGPGRHGHQGAA